MGHSPHLDSNGGHSIDTRIIHEGTELVKGAAVVPIFQSVTYGHRGDGPESDVGYTRPADTPNHTVLVLTVMSEITSCRSILTCSCSYSNFQLLLQLLHNVF